MKMAVPWRIHKKGIESLALLWGMYQLAWRDDEKITIEDIPELTIGMGRLTWLWAPEIVTLASISTTPVVILEVAVVVGAVASIAIAGEEGLETYVDYITNPQDILFDEGKRDAFGMAADVTLSLANPFHIPTKMAGEWLGENLPWGEVFRSRWVNPYGLPF